MDQINDWRIKQVLRMVSGLSPDIYQRPDVLIEETVKIQDELPGCVIRRKACKGAEQEEKQTRAD